ncbi:hypothetical protein HPB50_024344 [Hyalomma asiaticum]|uniref:Uncharacterized protein n=1 Tax=Hyalomma asiaticum TaxID=266040 RepID=A0ACB7RYS5_HYAAI|nr:hypothetical protein HPB50_024344 [Hyalomma asiaticum]
MVEFWWGSYLANVLSQQNKEDKERGASQVLVLGENVELPHNIYSLLKKGPKFSLEPAVQPHELLAFNWRVANRAPQEKHDRCLLEGVDALVRTVKSKKDFQGRATIDLVESGEEQMQFTIPNGRWPREYHSMISATGGTEVQEAGALSGFYAFSPVP